MNTRRRRLILIVVLFVGLAWIASSLPAATRFTVSGKIEAVTKDSQITLFADRPFYGPPISVATYVLWNLNRNTLFMASVPTTIPLTLDSKRAGFGDLKPGQYVVVEYELVLDYPIIYCAATRIDAHTALPTKSRSRQDFEEGEVTDLHEVWIGISFEGTNSFFLRSCDEIDELAGGRTNRHR